MKKTKISKRVPESHRSDQDEKCQKKRKRTVIEKFKHLTPEPKYAY